MSSQVFHWAMQERLEVIENSHSINRTAIVRMFLLMGFLAAADSSALLVCLNHIQTHGPTVKMLFAFEFGNPLINSLLFLLKKGYDSASHELQLIRHLVVDCGINHPQILVVPL